MNEDNEPDAIAELANRVRAKQRQGEEPGIEFELGFASLTDEERDEFMALMEGRIAHGEERLEGLHENARVLQVLVDLVESSGAPSGTTLGQALVAGYVTVLEVVESIRAVPDPVARQR